MKHESSVLIEELITSCNNIQKFLHETSADDYRTNILIKSAVERQFEIIGEALSRLSKEFPPLFVQIRNARRIIDFRNLISHGYDVISDDRVYQIAMENIPELIEDAIKIISIK